MSTGKPSDRWRNSRSFRQWAAVETITRVRIGRPTTSSCQVIENRGARACSAAVSSVRDAVDSTWTRMKNRPLTWSPNCWDSVMFPPCSASSPATACTMPGRSGQDRLSTQWVGVPASAWVASGSVRWSLTRAEGSPHGLRAGAGRRLARGRAVGVRLVPRRRAVLRGRAARRRAHPWRRVRAQGGVSPRVPPAAQASRERSVGRGRGGCDATMRRMDAPEVRIDVVDQDEAGELLTVRRAAFVSEAQVYDDPNIPPLTQTMDELRADLDLSLIHISEPTRLGMISYAVFCLKKKKKKQQN